METRVTSYSNLGIGVPEELAAAGSLVDLAEVDSVEVVLAADKAVVAEVAHKAAVVSAAAEQVVADNVAATQGGGGRGGR